MSANATLLSVFVAAAYAERGRARRVADALESIGCTVTHRWFEHPVDDDGLDDAARLAMVRGQLRSIGLSDVLVHLPPRGACRGGEKVELGYALAKAETSGLLIVSSGSTVLHHALPAVTVRETDAAVLDWVDRHEPWFGLWRAYEREVRRSTAYGVVPERRWGLWPDGMAYDPNPTTYRGVRPR